MKIVICVSHRLFTLFQSLVSGGVDSAVCTALLHRAIGTARVVAVHIDNGFLRKNESDKVKESLSRIGLNLKGKESLVLYYTFMRFFESFMVREVFRIIHGAYVLFILLITSEF